MIFQMSPSELVNCYKYKMGFGLIFFTFDWKSVDEIVILVRPDHDRTQLVQHIIVFVLQYNSARSRIVLNVITLNVHNNTNLQINRSDAAVVKSTENHTISSVGIAWSLLEILSVYDIVY